MCRRERESGGRKEREIREIFMRKESNETFSFISSLLIHWTYQQAAPAGRGKEGEKSRSSSTSRQALEPLSWEKSALSPGEERGRLMGRKGAESAFPTFSVPMPRACSLCVLNFLHRCDWRVRESAPFLAQVNGEWLVDKGS